MGALAFVVFMACTGAEAQQMMFGSPFLQVPAWTEHTTTVRYPASGTYDVSAWHYIGGMIGIDHFGPHARGTVTFFWTVDPAGTQIVGVRSLPLSSAIPSTNELRTMNRGPYLYLTYQPWFQHLTGPNRMAATLFGTQTGTSSVEIQLVPGDNILIDERDRPLTLRESIYPAGYYGGEVQLYFHAPPGVTVEIYGFDLTDQWWPLDSFAKSGTYRTVVPAGTWFAFIHDTQGPRDVRYTLAVTPLFGVNSTSGAPR
jgi:hypothetical protein